VVSHEKEFLDHLAGLASADRFVVFLNDIAETSATAITPKSLRTADDIDRFAKVLEAKYSDKSIRNYRSVMRKYVEMVAARRL
jgi:hypothetical protein